MTDPVESYLGDVGSRLRAILGDSLTAIWLVGSCATGDFDRRSSDIDLLVVSSAPLDRKLKEGLSRRLAHSSLTCPAHGLDLVLYREGELREIRRAPEYEFSIASGVDWLDDISFGGPYPGGLIDLALARSSGIALQGPKPKSLISSPPEEWVLEELLLSLRWHLDKIHDPFHDPTGSNAALNACRALYYRTHGVFVSKSAGAQWLLEQRSEPVVASALASRLRGRTDRLSRDAVESFVTAIIGEIDAGSS